MLYCKCVDKIRDENNIIQSYELVDFNGDKKVVDKELLKTTIRKGLVTVTNLKLTKDGKLVPRAVKEEAELMHMLAKDKPTEKDERQISKARMLGVLPTVDDKGTIVTLPTSGIIWITPEVKLVNLYTPERDYIISGETQIKVNYLLCNNLTIMNHTVLEFIMNDRIQANTIKLSFKDMDAKTIEFAFKATKKDEHSALIIVDGGSMDKELAFNAANKVLNRQKVSNVPDRRAYDVYVYVKFIYGLTLGFRDKTLLSRADEYILEFDDILGNYDYKMKNNGPLRTLMNRLKETRQKIETSIDF